MGLNEIAGDFSKAWKNMEEDNAASRAVPADFVSAAFGTALWPAGPDQWAFVSFRDGYTIMAVATTEEWRREYMPLEAACKGKSTEEALNRRHAWLDAHRPTEAEAEAIRMRNNISRK